MKGDTSQPPTFTDSLLFYFIAFALVAVFVSTLAWCIYLVLRHYAFPAIRRWYERPVLSKTQTVVGVDYGHDEITAVFAKMYSNGIIHIDDVKHWPVSCPQTYIRVVPVFYDWAEIPEWGLCDA